MKTKTILTITASIVASACISFACADWAVAGCVVCAGDMDGNGVRDGRDIQDFVDCFLGAGTYCHRADMNGDQVLTTADITLFVAAVLNATPCPTLPSGDSCQNPIPIDGLTAYPVAFNNSNATNDGPRDCFTSSSTKNLWYCYTASCTGTAGVSLCGSSFDTKLAVYDTNCSGALLACNDDDGPICSNVGSEYLHSSLIIPVTEGHRYLIGVGGYGSASGNGFLTVRCAPPPPDDFCVNATEIVGEVTNLPFDTLGASFDGPLPPPTVCMLNTHDIWYRWTATCNGVALIDLCGTGGDKTRLAVFSNWNCPPDQSYPPLSWYLACGTGNGPAGGPQAASVGFQVFAGEQYLIQIGGYNWCGAGDLTVRCYPPPPNDDCYSDLPLITPPQEVSGTTVGATLDCSFAFRPTVWYKVHLLYTCNTVTFAACGVSDNIYLDGAEGAEGAIVHDCYCDGPRYEAVVTPLACGSLNGATLTFNAVAGPDDVYLAVWLPRNRWSYSGLDFSATIDATECAGSCCVGMTCTVTTESNCAGIWTANGVCDPNPCLPTGSCCVGTSCTVTTQAQCSGTWTEGQTCTPDPCMTGSCCVGTTCTVTTEANCFGVWTSGGTCTPNPCLTGACCVDGGCITTTQADCYAGTWHAGEDCATFTCPPCVDLTLTAPGAISGDTCGAGNDCAARTSPDQVVEVVIPTPGNWIFSLCNSPSSWDSYIHLGTFCCGTDVWEDDDGCGVTGGLSKIMTYGLPAGTYYLTIEGYNSSSCGTWVLDVLDCTTPPANDNCANAIAIGDVANLPFDTSCATFDGPLPPPAVCLLNTNDLWYVYTPPCNGNATVDLCGSNFLGKLAVYPYPTSCPPDPGSALVCGLGDGPVCGNGQSSVAFDVQAGNQYLIEVGGWDTSFGVGDITARCHPSPVNDDCSGGLPLIDLSGGPQVVTGQTTIGATLDCTSFGPFFPAVWYRVNLPYACNNLTVLACGDIESIYDARGVLEQFCDCSGFYNYGSATSTPCGSLTGKTVSFAGVPGPGEVYVSLYLTKNEWGDRGGAGLNFSATFTATNGSGCP